MRANTTYGRIHSHESLGRRPSSTQSASTRAGRSVTVFCFVNSATKNQAADHQ